MCKYMDYCDYILKKHVFRDTDNLIKMKDILNMALISSFFWKIFVLELIFIKLYDL